MNKMSGSLAALFAVMLPVFAGAVIPVSAPERLSAAAGSAAAAVCAGDYASAESDLSALFSGARVAEAPVVYLEKVSLPERSARAVPEPARFEKSMSEDKAVPPVSAPAAVDGGKAASDKSGEKEADSSGPAAKSDIFGALGAVCLIAVALSGGTAALFFLCMLVLAC